MKLNHSITKQINIMIYLIAIVLIALFGNVSAAELYVDNLKGNDSGDGTQKHPFKTLNKAVSALNGSDTLHLVNNDFPYVRGEKTLQINKCGTAERPTIIDGHGAVINGLRRYPSSCWEKEGGGIFRMPLTNNAHVMNGYWQGFDLVFFNGKPGINCKTKDSLVDFGYLLYKNMKRVDGKIADPLHDNLFVRLPEGETPDSISVETVSEGTNFFVSASNVLVMNLTSQYASGDGFGSNSGSNIVFENLRSRFNMDQGISAHGSQVIVKKSWFGNNAGCGIVDVGMGENRKANVKYVNCIIEDDTYRGGIEFHEGVFEMEGCIVRNNPVSALQISQGAQVTVNNCIFIGNGSQIGIVVGGGCSLTMRNSTLWNFVKGLYIGGPETEWNIGVANCAFIGCKKIYEWRNFADTSKLKLNFNCNFLETAPLTAFGKNYSQNDLPAFIKETRLDANSKFGKYDGDFPPRVPCVIRNGVMAGSSILEK